MTWHSKAKQGQKLHGKTKQDKARNGMAEQSKARSEIAMHIAKPKKGKTLHGTAKQKQRKATVAIAWDRNNVTRHDNSRNSVAKQSMAR